MGECVCHKNESLEGELGEKMSSGRALSGEMASGVSESERGGDGVGEGRGGEGWREPR